MSSTLRFLIIDGYPNASREEFDRVGMKHAWRLYMDMLKKCLPEAEYVLWLPSDNPTPPQGVGPEHYDGILWTGCNLTIYHLDDARVTRQIEFARKSYEVGTPAFGTCWGIQMAAVAAGGEVRAKPARTRDGNRAPDPTLLPKDSSIPCWRASPRSTTVSSAISTRLRSFPLEPSCWPRTISRMSRR